MSADLFGLQPRIRCLSLWEPWASLMAAGFKRHETRHWPTAITGRVAIHAAKTREGSDDVAGELEQLCRFAFDDDDDWRETRPFGCVVAVGELVSCHRTSGLAPTLPNSDLISGDYAIGRHAFRFERVRPLLDPLPLSGRQGFFWWTPPADLEARLGPPVDHHAAAARWAEHAEAEGWL